MIKGKMDYIPPKEVKIIEKRKSIPLAEAEGLYIRNMNTGEVRLEKGPKTYLLKEDEELWNKVLSSVTEKLLAQNAAGRSFVPA